MDKIEAQRLQGAIRRIATTLTLAKFLFFLHVCMGVLLLYVKYISTREVQGPRGSFIDSATLFALRSAEKKPMISTGNDRNSPH